MDSRWSLPRSCVGVQLVVAMAADHGVDLDTCLRDTGVAPQTLGNHENEITGVQELQVIHNVVAAGCGGPGGGFAAGERYEVTMLGLWAYAIMSADDKRTAVEVGHRFSDLGFSLARATTEFRSSESVTDMDYRLVPPEVRMFVQEMDVAALFAAARGLFGRDDALSFQVHPRLHDSIAHLLPEGVARIGAQPDTSVLVVADDLDAVLPSSDPRSTAVFVRLCEELLADRRSRTGIAGAVSEAIVKHRLAEADQGEVAASLHMSVRTMRRRLAQEGTTFRDVVANTCRALAEAMLRAGTPVGTVAHRLGYASAPTFSRAFKAWTGVPPSEFTHRPRPPVGPRAGRDADGRNGHLRGPRWFVGVTEPSLRSDHEPQHTAQSHHLGSGRDWRGDPAGRALQ